MHEQIGLFSNFQEWLPEPRVENRKSPICSQVKWVNPSFRSKKHKEYLSLDNVQVHCGITHSKFASTS